MTDRPLCPQVISRSPKELILPQNRVQCDLTYTWQYQGQIAGVPTQYPHGAQKLVVEPSTGLASRL